MNEFCTTHHGKEYVLIRVFIGFSNRFIIRGELIDCNLIAFQFSYYICFEFFNSPLDMVSALAIMGIIFTLLSNSFMQTMQAHN